jgi:hypothetical protein
VSTSTNPPRGGRSVPASPSLLRTLLRPRNLAITALILFVVVEISSAAIIALVGWQKNPATIAEPVWDSPQTRALAVRACFDCHSHETVWPWYSQVVPASWLATRHVIEGREKFNLSAWGVTGASRNKSPSRLLEEAVEMIQRGEMPTKDYLLMHPEAKLTDAEKQQLIDGLNTSLR